MSGRLQGRVALITGGASGIGAATAALFIEHGARVTIADLNEAAGRALAEQLGPCAAFARLDVTSEKNWRDVVDTLLSQAGRLDVLVNGAGISGGDHDIEQISVEHWNNVLAINTTGMLLGCQNAIRAMKASGHGGSIINMSSALSIKVWAPRIAYGTSKAAISYLSKAVALHCGKAGYNIRCNSLHPGTTDTPILDEQLGFFNHDRAAMLAALGPFQALGRVANAGEIASAILFLASDESSFVTATEMVVDGGFVQL